VCRLLALLACGAFVSSVLAQVSTSPDSLSSEQRRDYDARMQWWNEARFGLFIHWGLYAIPAGEWGGKTTHGEWIRTTARIPVDVYEGFVRHFNPVRFDADEWVRMAKDAGMKYIVITSKHHDGFCLFDSKQTDFDVMSTPFKRDILKELADACRKQGIRICWYHSIMDWHHPDYLPRRIWEKDRPTEGADFDRYVQYMKNQLRELVTHYGEIGVLWFDGEWESTWNTKRGLDLYTYVRGLQPDIIINNRVGAGRSGMQGFTKEGEFAGDYATPEQEVPSTGIPGVYWETCMTMNDNWGYNKNDQHWKSSTELIRHLVDIASKGGNFLLNVGPTAEGVFPPPSVDRLRDIGRWMKPNHESIYGTSASPFPLLSWGRCTRKALPEGTRLYLHVFNYPSGGELIVPGIRSSPKQAYFLAGPETDLLPVTRREDALVISLPRAAPDTVNTVVVLDIDGEPDIVGAPMIEAATEIFIDTLKVSLVSGRNDVQVHYRLDGGIPDRSSLVFDRPILIDASTMVTARSFLDGAAVSPQASARFRKVVPQPAARPGTVVPGLRYAYYEGEWVSLPDFPSMEPVLHGVVTAVTLAPSKQEENFGFSFDGYIRIPRDGVYVFATESDDGSCLYVGGQVAVDNDGLHGMVAKETALPLAAGFHSIRITFFQGAGSMGLKVTVAGPGVNKQELPADMLFHAP
jgi:alpha-L-fucosidase